MEMLEALSDPAHPRHAEVTKWPGRDFDPSDANRAKLEKDVAALARLMSPRPPRRRSQSRRRSAASRRTTTCSDGLNGRSQFPQWVTPRRKLPRILTKSGGAEHFSPVP
jgi:hypothetical protein